MISGMASHSRRSRLREQSRSVVALLGAGALLAASGQSVAAADFNVADESQLRTAIFSANDASGADRIIFTGNVTLTQSLPMITGDLEIVGGSNTLDANNAGRAFFVQAGTVSIADITIDNAVAQGGNGGDGAGSTSFGGGGGGGGLGAGAAVFVNAGASVTLSGVTVGDASATGGTGGGSASSSGSAGGGGGGGLGGDGGNSADFSSSGGGGGGYEGTGGVSGAGGGGGGGGEFGSGGSGDDGGGGGGGRQGNGGAGSASGIHRSGGGGGGATADGATPTTTAGGLGGGTEGGQGGTNGGVTDGADGSDQGGGGGGGNAGAGGAGGFSGGGGGGVSTFDGGAGGVGGGGGGAGFGDGGAGGDFGGGGGSRNISVAETGGAGGFGGGGGGGRVSIDTGGAGGFGGGGGGAKTGGAGGSFGGQGGTGDAAAGGGGAALGGAVFVRQGGNLTITDGTFSGTYAVTSGAAGSASGGATAGSAQGRTVFLNGTGSLTFDITSGSRTLAGNDAIAGDGGLTKAGAGSLTISGTNGNFSGLTTITAGSLLIDGSLGPVTLGASGTLGGSGTLGQLTAAGRVAPGNSIGTLSSGPVTFNSGSVLAVEIAADGRTDLLDVTGTATINAGTVEVTPEAGSYVDGASYTILKTTGGVTGTFESVGYATGQSLNLFDLSLSYPGNDVLLTLTRNASNFAARPLMPGLTGPAAALDVLETSPTADSPALLQKLYPLSTAGFGEAVRQLSGSGVGGAAQTAQSGGGGALNILTGGAAQGGAAGAGLMQFALADSGPVTLLAGSDRAALSGAVDSGAGDAEARRFWVQAFGGFGSRDGKGAAMGLDHRYGGALAGVRDVVAEGLRLGVAVSSYTGHSRTDDRLAETDSRSYMVAGHANWEPDDHWRVDGALGFAHHRFESERKLDFGTFQSTATGDRNGHEALGSLSVRYERARGGLTVSPVAALNVSWLREEDWKEKGAAGANLAFDSETTLVVQPRFGIGLSTEVAVGEGLSFEPRAEALWVTELADRDSSYRASFVGSTTTWSVVSLEQPRHSSAVRLSADLVSIDGWATSLGYAGRFGGGSNDHGFLLGARVRF